jgi:excinuclease ABC subunit C
MLLKNLRKLSKVPGVYLMKNENGEIVYVGRATNLRERVGSYFKTGERENGRTEKPARVIEEAIKEVARVDYIQTSNLLEAMVLEANLIKKHAPKYNIREKDNRSFLYVMITNDAFPRIYLIRGQELKKFQTPNVKTALAVFGPFPSSSSLRAVLDILRKIFYWSNCASPLSPPWKGGEEGGKPCFYRRLGYCPGVCTGEITAKKYRRQVIKPLILFFQGKAGRVIKNFKQQMKRAGQEQKFEEAARLRDQLFALKHVQDAALIEANSISQMANRENEKRSAISATLINLFGRIEGYDISNISGAYPVGSMVVFEDGQPAKNEYRKFKIKTIAGANDVAMFKEVLVRRLRNNWPKPDFILIDGGRGQVNAAEEVLAAYKIHIPVLGLAKGLARKNDYFVYGKNLTPKERQELERLTEIYSNIFKQVRDEAHRFAIKFHRQKREKVI